MASIVRPRTVRGENSTTTATTAARQIQPSALWAKSAGHERWYYWYVTLCILGSLVVYATMRETRGTRLTDGG